MILLLAYINGTIFSQDYSYAFIFMDNCAYQKVTNSASDYLYSTFSVYVCVVHVNMSYSSNI